MAGRLSQDRFSRFAPSDTLSARRKKKNGSHAKTAKARRHADAATTAGRTAAGNTPNRPKHKYRIGPNKRRCSGLRKRARLIDKGNVADIRIGPACRRDI